jgi:hypothetical protein
MTVIEEIRMQNNISNWVSNFGDNMKLHSYVFDCGFITSNNIYIEKCNLENLTCNNDITISFLAMADQFLIIKEICKQENIPFVFSDFCD